MSPGDWSHAHGAEIPSRDNDQVGQPCLEHAGAPGPQAAARLLRSEVLAPGLCDFPSALAHSHSLMLASTRSLCHLLPVFWGPAAVFTSV